MKTQIFTRSMNYLLYDAAMKSIEPLGLKKNRLRAKGAQGYILSLLKSKAEWAVNIDEDAFVTDIDALKELIDYCKENGIVNCGMADGGVLPIRVHNPLVTNPFFNILDLKTLRRDYSDSALEEFAVHKKQYENKTPMHLMRCEFQYDYFEPYCNFFVWTSQNFKTLYLDARTHSDGVSTVLLNHLGKPFLLHTWYSRFYGADTVHTARINEVIDKYSFRTKPNKLRAWSDEFINKAWYAVVKKFGWQK